MKGYCTFSKVPAFLEPPSDCLVSYPGHSLGESYPSAEIQSVYSAAQADLACNTFGSLKYVKIEHVWFSQAGEDDEYNDVTSRYFIVI